MHKLFIRIRLSLLLVVFAGLALMLAGCGSAFRAKRQTPTSFETVKAFANAKSLSEEPFGVAIGNEGVYYSSGNGSEMVKGGDGHDGSIVRIGFEKSELTFYPIDGFSTPSQIAFDDKGNLLVADTGSSTIKRLSATGAVEIVAGAINKPGFADGDAKSGALFRAPVGIAFGAGKIYVADTYNDRIRVIDESGRVSTLAGATRGFADGNGAVALFDTPCGLAFENGKLYVADTGNRRIRVVDVATGAVSTLAGNGGGDRVDGSPDQSSFVQPIGIAADADGVLLITDGNAIRRYVPARASKDKEPATEARVETFAGEKRGFVDGALSDARFSRPSGIAVDQKTGRVFVADSDNGVVRVASADSFGAVMPDEKKKSEPSAEKFRAAAPARWPYDPPANKREIAGTLGEVRGEMKEGSDEVWFHNGLDVVGGYGETSRFVRSEKVLKPLAAENFGTLRELVRMPTMGYIHIRLGRDQNDKLYNDDRFVFDRDASGKLVGVRIPRGAEFKAGEPIGTLNPMNHTHLIAGRSGGEMNALAALDLPGVSDKIAPVIEETAFYDENWKPFETAKPNARINLRGKVRIVVKAYDRMDGNAERRRLGVYEVGYQVLTSDGTAIGDARTSIKFDRLPDPDAVFLVYANGSKSGATGETIFRYIATNEVHGSVAREDFLDVSALAAGNYIIRLTAGDFFGNKATGDVAVSIN